MTSVRRNGKSPHNLRDDLLGARLIPWMFLESGGDDWWLCAITASGEFVSASNDNIHKPSSDKIDYAQRICRHVNQVANHGGAWVTAWFGNKRFYLLWKDCDGDIHIPIECDKGWEHIMDWRVCNWAEQAEQAFAVWSDFITNMEISKSQQVCLAKGGIALG